MCRWRCMRCRKTYGHLAPPEGKAQAYSSFTVCIGRPMLQQPFHSNQTLHTNPRNDIEKTQAISELNQKIIHLCLVAHATAAPSRASCRSFQQCWGAPLSTGKLACNTACSGLLVHFISTGMRSLLQIGAMHCRLQSVPSRNLELRCHAIED